MPLFRIRSNHEVWNPETWLVSKDNRGFRLPDVVSPIGYMQMNPRNFLGGFVPICTSINSIILFNTYLNSCSKYKKKKHRLKYIVNSATVNLWLCSGCLLFRFKKKNFFLFPYIFISMTSPSWSQLCSKETLEKKLESHLIWLRCWNNCHLFSLTETFRFYHLKVIYE